MPGPRLAIPNRLPHLLALFAAAVARAQFTEVPSTVPVGTWQLEADVGSVSWDSRMQHRDGITQRTWSLASLLLSTGVAPDIDLQLGFEPYLRFSYNGPSGREVHEGRGDTYLRAKWNFHGDPSRGPAFALLPYLKLPTSRQGVGNRSVKGGLILPFGAPLRENVLLNAMASLDWAEDGAGGTELLVSASSVVIWTLRGPWSVYAESGLTGHASGEGAWSGITGVGLLWAQTERLSWDFAGYGAITRAAPDWSAALRIVWLW